MSMAKEIQEEGLNPKFITNLVERRHELMYSVEELSNIVGITNKYLYNIERRNKVDTGTHIRKNITLNKLNKLILGLSARDKVISDIQALSPNDLDFDELIKLSLSALGLEKYLPFYKTKQQINTSEHLISKYVDNNGLDNDKIENISHEFEIWTFSDVIGEYLYAENAKSCANNILKYKIKYIFIHPIGDNIEWKGAKENILHQVNEILSTKGNSNLKKYWVNEKWLDYIEFIGVPDSLFLSRIRIYNPKNNAEGNYNIGGKSLETIELVDLRKERSIEITNKIHNIIAEVRLTCKMKNKLYNNLSFGNAMIKF
jgi:hypothetical protein